MTKKVVIITISAAVGDSYNEFLRGFFGKAIEIKNFSMEKDVFSVMDTADLYIVGTTSSDVFDYVMSLVPLNGNVVVSSLTFTKESVEKLKKFPRGTEAMLVNLSANMSIETIADLNRLGVTNIKFYPVYPESEDIPDIELAITPGERRYVPRKVKQVIDIGFRVFSASVVIEIALKLGFTWFVTSEKCKNYVDSLAEQDYSLDALATEKTSMDSKMEILIETMEFAIIGVDLWGKVFLCNSIAEKLWGVEKSKVFGNDLADVFPVIDKSLSAEERRSKNSRLINVRDTTVSMSTVPIMRQNIFMGFYVILQRFFDEEKRQQNLRLQLLERGYTSKYTFDDIVGECPAIVKAKNIAKKMALTDSSILLTGESGTGKELFAHSIHYHSKRRDMPFVAINCAALPETLLESELFGYAEGSFTGAKKGGKLGLFEHAHNGTLFLDEIEGMSPNLQVKLLRVLQEKEIMRIGENKTISVDVRIVAASNENMRDMVNKGTFRKDLYYRINTLPIDIPPLRERGEDIFLLVDVIMAEIGAKFTFTHAAKEAFRVYIWDGNVRELRNIIEYLKFMDLDEIGLEDLPELLMPQERCGEKKESPAEKESSGFNIDDARKQDFDFVLEVMEKNPAGIGRNAIYEKAVAEGIRLTPQQIRRIIAILSKEGYVVSSKGRGGSWLSEKGKNLLKINK